MARARRKDASASVDERIWAQPNGDEDDGEAIRRRVDWILQYLDVQDLGRLATEIDTFRERRARMRHLPRDDPNPDRPLPRGGVEAVTADGRRLRATAAEAPQEAMGWAHSGRYVEVGADEPFAAATLRFGLAEDEIRHLHSGTILIARWDEARDRYAVIPQSGYDDDAGYAFARITQPGLFSAVGLPRDPGILTTLSIMSTMRPWIAADDELGRLFVPPICQLILCANFVGDMVGDERFLGGLGFTQDDFTYGVGGGDICEQCLGVDVQRLPELDIFDLADLPRDILTVDFDFPSIWPPPRRIWDNLGPLNVTGRTGALAIHPTNGAVLYAGTTGGGVWKTANGGGTWLATMSEELSLAIGGLGIADSDPSVLYAATGEWTAGIGWPIDPVVRGVGVYRTSDGGATWDLCAPISSTNCAAVAVEPMSPDRVFVAGERALHRSTDGGASWDIAAGMVYGVFDGEVSDVVVDVWDINRVYIGVHRDGVYRSTDGGTTWTRLQNGIDTGQVADAPKIALGRNGTNRTRFVAVKMGDRVYTSTDGGTAFQRRTDVGNPIWFTAWANVIAVDPDDEDVLFAGASDLYRSTDGGASWTKVGGYLMNVHPDMQSIVFDPADHNHVYVANDGGIWSSTDNGVTWRFVSRGLVATHFYVMGISQTPTRRYGGSIQDDSGYAFNGFPDWVSLRLAEGGYLEYDPSNERVMYHDVWDWPNLQTNLQKTTDGGANWTDLGIQTDTNYAEPLAIARANTNLLLALRITVPGAGGWGISGTVARSTNGGTTWTNVLTPGAGVGLSAVQFAPSDDHHAYVASTLGRVWHSANAGKTWTELNTAAHPLAKVQTIAVDWANPRRLYVALAGTGIRHLFRGDLNKRGNVTWFDVSGASPAASLPDLPLTGLALDPTLDEVIYVSTLLGVLRSMDGGDSWAPFDTGLPNAFVSDLDVRPYDRSLFASTMGRGMYRRFL